jgi:hypothetical protein
MKLGTLEMKIARVEGFQVRIRTSDGRDIRSDREGMPPWPYEKGARDRWSVARRKQDRFVNVYPGSAWTCSTATERPSSPANAAGDGPRKLRLTP